MPARTTPLVTGQFYHIFNRGVNKQPIFLNRKDYARALSVFEFYSFVDIPIRFSKFLLLSLEERFKILKDLRKRSLKYVDFISYCFMPNHFHFLVKQNRDNGISKFMGDFQNSYTKYFNTKHERIGPILQGQFKAVFVEDENQLLHLSRYIHLNPFTSFVVKDLTDLDTYPWSSFPEYLGNSSIELCHKQIVMANFKAKELYKSFVFDQADYQRELDKIKHIAIER